MALVQAAIGLASPQLRAGCDFQWVIVLAPPAGAPYTEATLATLLVGATVTASIVDTDDAATEILVLTGALDSAPNRKISLTTTAAATADLVPGIYRWQVRVTMPASSGAVVAVDLGPAQVFAA